MHDALPISAVASPMGEPAVNIVSYRFTYVNIRFNIDAERFSDRARREFPGLGTAQAIVRRAKGAALA